MILLRSTLFNLYFFLLTFLLTVLLATPVRLIAPHRVLDVARLWARLLLSGVRYICGIHLSVKGLERVSAGPALIASNHQSAFDTFVWLTLTPRCCYILKEELLRIPLFGPLLPLAGMIAVNRSGGATAIRHLLREGDRALREERQIVIFPEGTRASPSERLPLQPGVAALAIRTGLPLIPAVTDSGRCWGRRAFQKRPGTINIRLLEPLSPESGRATLMHNLNQALRTGVVENSVG